MTTRPLFLAALVSSTVLFALSGCGKTASQSAADAAVAAATGGKVQVSQSGDNSQTTIKDDKGNEIRMNSGGNVALPKDFPSDVHLPSSYAIKNAISAQQMFILELHTTEAMQSLYSEYDTSMKAGGWTEVMAMQASGTQSMLTFKKDKRSVVVTIVTAADGIDVQLQIANDQK